MQQHENGFEVRLKALDRDSIECAAYGYTEFLMGHQAANSDVLDRLQLHAGFWNRVRAALQGSMFVSLARIYDSRPDAHRARDLLEYAETYYRIFSRDALRVRKQRGGLTEDAARDFASDAYEMPSNGFKTLQAALAVQQQVFKDKIGPIRHEVYAHAGQITAAERDALFQRLPMRTLEAALVFPLQLHDALWQLYHNGREPTLRPAPALLAEVLQAIPPEHHTTWEHLHVTKDATVFFDWLKRHPETDAK